MLKQIDKTLSYNYEFYLCRRDTREPIATLKHGYNMYNASYKAEYRNIDELSFEIPFFVRNKRMKIITNPIWDLIKTDMVVEMIVSMGDEELFTQYFIINSPQKVGSGESKKKVAHCYGYEQSLNNIKIRMFQGTRQLYLSPSETVETGQGILNLLEEKTYGDWKVGYISPSAMNENISGQNHRKYRTFNVSDKSWLDFIRTELELSFDCVFEFTYDKIQNCNLINVYSTDEYGQDQGLYISEKNYIDKLTEEPNIDELVTRLTILGKDNLTINSVNLGRGYIEDMNYYRNLDYMSQELLNAFNTYDSLVEQKTPIFQGYLNQIKDLTSQLNTKSNEMATLKSQMSILQDNKDIAISQGLDQTSINAQIASKQAEINTKQGEIDSINSQITTVTNNINTLNNDVKLENNFTQEQLKVINKYLREAVWSNENYYEVNSLLEAGKKAQKKMNEPLLNLSVELPSFVDIVECQYDWKKLKIGDVVYCEYTLWNDFFQTRVVGYTHDITNKTLKIDLSNRDFKYDSQRYISELSKEVSNTSGLVNSKKSMWDMSEQNGAWVADFIANGLDATTYAVRMDRNDQKITLDERGIELASYNNTGVIRMLNNIIALSEDGVNYDLSMTPQGIIARKIIGELLVGEKLVINNESGTVQINGDCLTVKTPTNQIKVKLGKLDNGNYGIAIYNASGQVVLDENGLLQTLPYSREDNVDATHKLLFLVKIPNNTISVRSATLAFKLLPFRAYEKSIIGGSSSINTSASGGSHRHKMFEEAAVQIGDTDVIGCTYVASTQSSVFNAVSVNLDINRYFITDKGIPPLYTAEESGSHSHGMAHTHTNTLEYGIFESTTASGINIYIDGVLRVNGNYTTDQNNIDISQWLTTSGYHSVEISSNTLGRVNASIDIQAFVSS